MESEFTKMNPASVVAGDSMCIKLFNFVDPE